MLVKGASIAIPLNFYLLKLNHNLNLIWWYIIHNVDFNTVTYKYRSALYFTGIFNNTNNCSSKCLMFIYRHHLNIYTLLIINYTKWTIPLY